MSVPPTPTNGSDKQIEELESLIAATQLDVQRVRSSVLTVSAAIDGFKEKLMLARNDLGMRIKELNKEIEGLKRQVEQFEGDLAREIAARAREQAKQIEASRTPNMPLSVVVLLSVQIAALIVLSLLTLWR